MSMATTGHFGYSTADDTLSSTVLHTVTTQQLAETTTVSVNPVGSSIAPWEQQFLVSETYRRRNGILGVVGAFLNLLVLPVICVHDDLSVFLKVVFCCMATGDLLMMVACVLGGVLPADMFVANNHYFLRTISNLVFFGGNVTCVVWVTVAAERVLVLRNPQLFKRLERSKLAILAALVLVWATGAVLTIPILIDFNLDLRAIAPFETASDLGVAMESAITISASAIVFTVYVYLANTLKRRSSRSTMDTSTLVSNVNSVTAVFNTASTSRRDSQCSNTPSQLLPHMSASSTGATPNVETGQVPAPTPSTPSTLQLQRFRRATVHSAFLAVWFFLAYAPFGFYCMYVLILNVDRMQEGGKRHQMIISALPLINSLVDPLLVFWRLLPFWKIIRRLRRILRRVGRNCCTWVTATCRESIVPRCRVRCRRRMRTRVGPLVHSSSRRNTAHIHPGRSHEAEESHIPSPSSDVNLPCYSSRQTSRASFLHLKGRSQKGESEDKDCVKIFVKSPDQGFREIVVRGKRLTKSSKSETSSTGILASRPSDASTKASTSMISSKGDRQSRYSSNKSIHSIAEEDVSIIEL